MKSKRSFIRGRSYIQNSNRIAEWETIIKGFFRSAESWVYHDHWRVFRLLSTTEHIPLSPQTQQLTGLKFKMAEGEQHIHGRRNIRIMLHLALDVGGVEFNWQKTKLGVLLTYTDIPIQSGLLTLTNVPQAWKYVIVPFIWASLSLNLKQRPF